MVEAVAPKPLNLLVSSALGLTHADLEALGVRRISVGSGLARAAWGAFMNTAERIARDGDFSGFAQNRPFAEINAFFRKDLSARSAGTSAP
jgi:2-methylisocitrate lyase-like PEP mutase family enzyme